MAGFREDEGCFFFLPLRSINMVARGSSTNDRDAEESEFEKRKRSIRSKKVLWG